MLRKGWRWQESALEPKDMEDIIKIHNTNNEQAWLEVTIHMTLILLLLNFVCRTGVKMGSFARTRMHESEAKELWR